MIVLGWTLAFVIIGAIVVSIANTEKEKRVESAVGGGILGFIVIFGLMLLIVLPMILLKSC